MSKLVYFTGDIALVDNLGIEECMAIQEPLKKLHEYEIAEEQGLLLRLPCKVGDTVWLADEKFSKDIKCLSIRYIEIVAFIWFRAILEDGSGILFADYDIGKKVFLTKEEAEQKLAEMKGEV